MNYSFIVIVLLAMSLETRSQTAKEWLEQGKTQIEYLRQQLAAQQVYLDYLEKGYALAHYGLQVISAVKNKRLSMHSLYFQSLKDINPCLAGSPALNDMVSLEKMIIKKISGVKKAAGSPAAFNSEETVYINKLSDHLLEQAAEMMEEATTLLTNDNAEMKDSERIVRLQSLAGNIRDLYSFSAALLRDVSVLSVQRKRERSETENQRIYSGIQ